MVTPKQLFGVVVRGFGLSNVMASLCYFLAAFYHPYAEPGVSSRIVTSLNNLHGVCFLLLGLHLLRGAPGLMRFCYPEPSSASETKA